MDSIMRGPWLGWTSLHLCSNQASRLGNAPQVICADFNFQLSSEDAMPAELSAVRRMGKLVDAMHSRAHAARTSAVPTFHAGPHEGTRINGILMDPRLFSVVTMTEVTPVARLLG